MAMFQPSTSTDPLLTRGGDSDSDSGESLEEHAFSDDFSVRELGDLITDVDEDQTVTPISKFTVVDGVDANVLKLPREDQRFIFVEFSPDWSVAVTATSDGTFSLWDTRDKFVLVGSKRLQHDGGALKCIAFDPYDDKAVLLCFHSGEIFRANLRRLWTSGVRGISQDQPVFLMERVHMCQGRPESRFDHFKFSSDRKVMVYYSPDGVFAAIQFQGQDRRREIMLTKDFVLKQQPIVYISGQSILVSSLMKSSEDLEPNSLEIQTLFWPEPKVSYGNYKHRPVSLKGKGYLSNDGKYVLTSSFTSQHQPQCCQIEVFLAKDVKSNKDFAHVPLATRILKFASNHPHLDCLDWNNFSFLNANHEKTHPLVAIHQTNSTGTRMLLWDTNPDEFLYEIDLTLNKGSQKFSEAQYCFSRDCKWLWVCFFASKMIGLVCVRSGVFVWTSHVPQISLEDVEFSGLRFDPSGIRLMIYIGKTVYMLEPPCLSKKPQKHPMLHNIHLGETLKTYTGTNILEMTKAWPKQVLFNVLLAGQRTKLAYQYFLLDAAISLSLRRLALICRKYEGHSFVCIVDYSKTPSWESFWFVVMSRWNQCFHSTTSSPLVKEIGRDQRQKGISVFYYDNKESGAEHVVLLSSKGGIELQDLDSGLNQLSQWERVSDEDCFSFTQSKDRRQVVSITNSHVLVIDLNEKIISAKVKYSVGISQWWKSFLDGVKFFGYSHYYDSTDKECGKERELFLQDSLVGPFDVSNDGKRILIGWDDQQKRSLVLTPDKTEEQFRFEWDEAYKSLYQCSMITQDGQWIGFIDYEKLKNGDIIVCVIDASNDRQKNIWLGLDESLVKSSSECKLPDANFFLQLDETEDQLMALGLEESKMSNKSTQFSLGHAHDGNNRQGHQFLLEDIVQSTNLDKYGERDQPSIFNMSVATISNFQRVLAEEGENKMEGMAKCALLNKTKVSNIRRFCQDNEHDHLTFLTYAQERKETTLVQLCLRFIKDGLFPFHSASAMMKDSFFELLLSYDELLLPMLEKNFLTFKVAEIKVPAEVFKSKNSLSNAVFTSDTLLEPNEHLVEMASEDFQKSKSIRHLGSAMHQGERRKVLSSVSFHYIANACKVGLHGIVRKLLMFNLDSSIFKTELIRATITWKWEKLWRRKCLHQLYLYIIFLAFFTSYAIGIGISGDSLMDNKVIGLGISFPLLVAIMLTIYFSHDEYMQLKTYVKDGKEVFGKYEWGFKHYFLDLSDVAQR